MKLTQYFLSTLKEVPRDAHLLSHKLMLRAGLIEKISTGFYSYLPLGLKILRKVESIIRHYLNKAGALECLLPLLIDKELLSQTKRWKIFNKELFRLQDRHQRDIALAPTHEEIITFIAKNKISSYKQLPLNLYQITAKFRDEVRPRFGVMRAREFIMKDAYSFHNSPESLSETYQKMNEAYNSIFRELGLDFVRVKADSGAIGGEGSEEFMVKSEVGEDEIAICEDCNYAANLEKAVEKQTQNQQANPSPSFLKINTPNAKKISEVLDFLAHSQEIKTTEFKNQISQKSFIKTILYEYQQVSSENWFPVIVLIRGDYQINEVKLNNVLQTNHLRLASNSTVERIFSCSVGYLGPILENLTKDKQKTTNLKNIKVIADFSLQNIQRAITGANQENYHLLNVDLERDCTLTIDYCDIHQVTAEGKCNFCKEGKLKIIRGIEVGHIFKLQDKYTKAMNFIIPTEEGNSKAPLMGCYGIGVNRTLAAIIEQNHDASGLIWPKSIAPFTVNLLTLDLKDQACYDYSEELYNQLLAKNIEVLWDDREERAGFKFKDADLLGIPYQIIIGKKSLSAGEIEVKVRRNNIKSKIKLNAVLKWLEKELH